MISRRGASRRATIERWVASLRPCYDIIEQRLCGLKPPRVDLGPTYMDRDRFDDGYGERIRRGAVWFVNGANTGFHVDFLAKGVQVEAWSGDRRVTLTVNDKVTASALRRDLNVALIGAGVTRLVKLDEARDAVLNATEHPEAESS